MCIPEDPIMLLSIVNMKLRDDGIDFQELCNRENLSSLEIENKLKKIGYKYDREANAFV